MSSKNIYLVWAHPRSDSLTARITEEIHGQASLRGMEVTTLDLYRRDFNPVLGLADEPDWGNPDKQYSSEVHQLFKELEGHDTLIIVYPVWWWSFPAILKGYLDRIWNHGLAYGAGRRMPFSKIRWIALVGGSEEKFTQKGWDRDMSAYLHRMASYVGIQDAESTFLYNTVGVEKDINNHKQHYQKLFAQARDVMDKIS